ncbi:hypothetical protein [Methanosphaerula palustris]|uniref:hypothetical protein n=1 Tax=Methanosphaerula palustris TaxID=475088 RepID=UPI0011D09E6D|nr:hypothetical protein [Methanosphaerula palustris]
MWPTQSSLSVKTRISSTRRQYRLRRGGQPLILSPTTLGRDRVVETGRRRPHVMGTVDRQAMALDLDKTQWDE